MVEVSNRHVAPNADAEELAHRKPVVALFESFGVDVAVHRIVHTAIEIYVGTAVAHEIREPGDVRVEGNVLKVFVDETTRIAEAIRRDVIARDAPPGRAAVRSLEKILLARQDVRRVVRIHREDVTPLAVPAAPGRCGVGCRRFRRVSRPTPAGCARRRC